ncbi:MAG: MFS transporter [Myxococcaceae bacterium]|nr:MFS transporter [Myxococcaceae bacterium]MBH2006139.1 MFS transporter [Myxococcaceae bacterium]
MIYWDQRIGIIFLLGIASGLPLLLTGGTLGIWLAESGANNTAIGLFALVGIPYTFKFLWSPLVDQLSIPWLTQALGRRRSWMLLSQVLLLLSLLGFSLTNPAENLRFIALLALLVAFLSATQDIAIDAYRVDILDERLYGAGAATAVLGYRIGMMISGAGALYLASFFAWGTVYGLMAAVLLCGILATLLGSEPAPQPPLTPSSSSHWFTQAVWEPLLDFAQRPRWISILVFVILYKLGDAFVSNMTSPFYVAVGFSKIEIAHITKIFGLAATLGGGFLGGWLMSRTGIYQALFVCGILQLLSNLAFVWQAQAGHETTVLMLVIAIENITSGMGTAALVAYLSKLCHASYTATQYALLSSLTAVGRTFLASPCGWIADQLSWTAYFSISTLIALPGLLLLVYLMRSDRPVA